MDPIRAIYDQEETYACINIKRTSIDVCFVYITMIMPRFWEKEVL